MFSRGFLNEDHTLTVDFEVDGDRVVPTPGATTYTVRDTSGAPIAGLTDKALAVSSTQQKITIPGANHATAGFYHVSVQFDHLGATHSRRFSYRIAAFVPIAATPDNVRSLMALTWDELPDQDIDLEYGFQALVDDGFDLTDQLKATDSTAYHANRAVALKTALDLTFSLPLRALQSEKSEVGSAARFTLGSKDWENLRRDLANKLSHAVLKATGGTATVPVLMVTTAPVDPITGV